MEHELGTTILEVTEPPFQLASSSRLSEMRPDYEQLSAAQCLEIAERLFQYWLAILSRDPGLLDQEANHDTDAAWRQASIHIAVHFLPALARAEELLLAKGGKPSTSGWFPFTDHGIKGRAGLCTGEYGFDAAVERRLLSEYLSGVWHCFFMTVVGSPVLGKTHQGWDEFVHWSFEAIADVCLASAKSEHFVLGSLFTRELAKRARAAARERDLEDFAFRDQVGGVLAVTHELPWLAKRLDHIVERYGSSEIEVRFEKQLSLLMQSFGFIVAGTQRGQRRVDLICIAPAAGSESYTLIVEAKTSANDYSLPPRDARAIAEYVSSIRSTLNTLPPLRLVLVVSGTHTETIHRKLGELEAECGVPTRYCDAMWLSRLRHSIPGPVNHAQFLKTCVTARSILKGPEVDRLVEGDKAIRTAHADFIRTILLEE
ncbi:hypothetical protein [Nonomuraea africana]|uniref:hypothetical protein n=1 Tax=Nonomuraea africana TaxID=46171 RepID=UPI0033FEA83B